MANEKETATPGGEEQSPPDQPLQVGSDTPAPEMTAEEAAALAHDMGRTTRRRMGRVHKEATTEHQKNEIDSQQTNV